MKTLKIRMAVTAVCLLGTIIIVSQLIHAHAPTAPPAQRVSVENPPTRPVPVAVQGTVNVTGYVGPAKQNWEYLYITIPPGEDIEARLNRNGLSGWELVGFTINNTYVFKRPV